MAWLGEAPNQIAFEKAGIFRPGRPAIIGSRTTPPRLRGQAEAIQAEVHQLGREFDWQLMASGEDEPTWSWRHQDGTALSGLPLPALSGPARAGQVQLDNAAAALCALHARAGATSTGWSIPPAALREGLRTARLPGRFQVIPGRPRWVLDVAHNEDAVRVLAENVRALKALDQAEMANAGQGQVHVVFGVAADKEAGAMARVLAPLVDHWYLAEPAAARAMPVDKLNAEVGAVSRTAPRVCDDLSHALHQACCRAGGDDLILVTGSFMTVEAGLRYCLARSASGATAGMASV
jgi:dihydrofolate synthase/folylpolyglutamate synthase